MSEQIDFERAAIMSHAGQEALAILPSALTSILSRPIEARGQEYGAAAGVGQRSGVQVINVFGGIARRDSFWSQIFGGATVEKIAQALRAAGADSTIKNVVLNFDSPGGVVSGMPELAGEVRRLAQSKRVVALANSLTASAAYWLASQAHEIIATPEALIGSIGVFTVHEDYSKMLDKLGIKTTYVSAGKFKVEGNPDEPLSASAKAHMQSLVDDAYNLFVADVARGRHIPTAAVRSNYGEGRVLSANEARAAGMIDRIATADAVIQGLTSGAGAGARLALQMRNLELIEAEAGLPRRSHIHEYRRRRLELAEKAI